MKNHFRILGGILLGGMLSLAGCRKEAVPAPAAPSKNVPQAKLYTMDQAGQLIYDASPELYSAIQESASRGPNTSIHITPGLLHYTNPNDLDQWLCFPPFSSICVITVKGAETVDAGDVLDGVQNNTLEYTECTSPECINDDDSEAPLWFIAATEDPQAVRIERIYTWINADECMEGVIYPR